LGPAMQAMPQAGISSWKPTRRYLAPAIPGATARKWIAEADAIFQETIASMKADGVI